MTKDEALKLAFEALKDMNCGWKYIRESHGDLYGVGWDRAQQKADDAITALRQALDHVPDTTKMIEPDMGIDRGAWDDVPDATKWVDELRGGDETEQEPVAWKHDCAALLTNDVELWIDRCPHCGKPRTAPPKRKWQGLTQEDIPDEYDPVFDSDEFIAGMAWAQAKLKEKNT